MKYALNKSFTKSKKGKKVSYKNTKVKIKGLKRKKTYYVKVRAYVKNGTKKMYGAWSGIKKIKIK